MKHLARLSCNHGKGVEVFCWVYFIKSLDDLCLCWLDKLEYCWAGQINHLAILDWEIHEYLKIEKFMMILFWEIHEDFILRNSYISSIIKGSYLRAQPITVEWHFKTHFLCFHSLEFTIFLLQCPPCQVLFRFNSVCALWAYDFYFFRNKTYFVRKLVVHTFKSKSIL